MSKGAEAPYSPGRTALRRPPISGQDITEPDRAFLSARAKPLLMQAIRSVRQPVPAGRGPQARGSPGAGIGRIRRRRCSPRTRLRLL